MNSSPPKSSNKYKKIISINKNDTIGDFKIGSKIGQGTFSKVCMGIHIPTGEKVAIKILQKNQIKEKTDKIRIEKEINLQKKLHHQNIIHQYSVLDTETAIYIITEYCSGGELFDYIVSKRRLPEVEACRIFQQLINGLEYLHKQKICHRDLKPENLLFDAKKNLKIADFGLSNEYINGKLGTPCGSPCYAAPEMVTGQKYMGDTVDIWSSGIVLYSMVCGYLPFEDDDQTVLFHKIAKGLFTLPGYLSYKCKDLIKNILITNPNKRYGFEDIKRHPWFMSVNNISGKNNLFNSPGIIIDYDVIPIDINIIKEMYFAKEYKNFSVSNIISDVIKNKHNKITTGYYLILKKKLRKNEQSVSDINSNSKLFIEYMNKPISKMSYWDNDYEKIINYYTEKVKEIINKKKEAFNYKKYNLPVLATDADDIVIYKDKDRSITDEKRLYDYKLRTDTNYNELKLETITYNDDTEKNKKKHIPIVGSLSRRKNPNIILNNDTEDEYHAYKLTNYELDSEETLMKEINNYSFNKKEINEFLKINENNTIDEKENNNPSSESSEISFNKIIKQVKNNTKLNRNKKNDKKINNPTVENMDMNQKNNIDNYSKKIYNLSNDKTKNCKYVYNNMNMENKNIKVYKKEKIDNNNISVQVVSNNSYLYKKIKSMIAEDKINKFINKKVKQKIIQKENDNKHKVSNNLSLNENKNNNNYKKINLKLKFNNKRLQTQETKNPHTNNNYINSIFNDTNRYKDTNTNINFVDEKNNKTNNNIKVQNINNYIIDVYKYKINLIGNMNYCRNMNLLEIYKNLNNPNRYDKFISNSNKKNVISNNNIKENYKISIPENNRKINNYLSPEHNLKKSKIRHLSELDISSNNHVKNQIKNENVVVTKLTYPKNKERSVNQNRNNKLRFMDKRIINIKSDDKDNKKSNKMKFENKFKKYSPFKIQSNHIYKVKKKIRIPYRNHSINMDKKNNTFFTNSLINENISFKENIPNKTDINAQTDMSNENKNIKSNRIKNLKSLSININPNKSSSNRKERVYHKKFINLNKRKNNSVENENRKMKYNLEINSLNNDIHHNNYSLISLYSNQIKNIKNIDKLKKKIINNLTNINQSISLSKANKDNLAKRKSFLSQERAKKLDQVKKTRINKFISNNIINKNIIINKIPKKENIKQTSIEKDKNYFNNLNNNPSLICTKHSINRIKEVVKKVFSNKINTMNNNNNLIINTLYSNSSIILRCKFVNKICKIYFELHISFCKDSQKFVLIKPNLLNGNKLFFMKLFEKIKNELIN